MKSNNPIAIFCFLLLICQGCVPLQQQIAESEAAQTEGFVGPLIIDQDKFYRIASQKIYGKTPIDDSGHSAYAGTFDGDAVYIRNCKCLRDAQIIQNKLVVTHSYGGGESNRNSTELLWNGRHYKNAKGDYIVDVMLHSDKVDIRRALFTEKKVLDVEGVQMEGVRVVWINLLGYDRLLKYAY